MVNKFVRVEWIDSEFGEQGWISEADAIEWAEETPIPCQTTGELIFACNTHIVVAQSSGPKQYSGMIKIPRCAIIRISTKRRRSGGSNDQLVD